LQWGPQHGYGIVQALHTRSEEVLRVETGSLYPALHRLERKGWVRSEWKQTESNQRAQYYRISATGKKELLSDHERWQQMTGTIDAIMRVVPPEMANETLAAESKERRRGDGDAMATAYRVNS